MHLTFICTRVSGTVPAGLGASLCTLVALSAWAPGADDARLEDWLLDGTPSCCAAAGDVRSRLAHQHG